MSATTAPAVTLGVTENAAIEIKKFMATEDGLPETSGLRVRVVPGGCSGFSYSLNIEEESRQGDFILDTRVVQSPVKVRGHVNLTGEYEANVSMDTASLPLDVLMATYGSGAPEGFQGQTELHATVKGPLKDKAKLEAHLTIPTFNATYQSLQIGAAGPIRVAGISANPRFSGSDHLLRHALDSCAAHGAESKMIRLSELKFRACEGYYSKSAHACTWPCSITQMDDSDQMDRVYEALVHWADAIIVATPIRWGAASSLYFKMAERLNCVQNAITIRDQVLIRNKVAGFIIVGGQDNIQGVAGQMLGFFAELGFVFPQFPYVAHSRGWSSEDMERNVEIVRQSGELAEGAAMLAKRCVDLARHLVAQDDAPTSIERGGRKAHTLEMEKPDAHTG